MRKLAEIWELDTGDRVIVQGDTTINFSGNSVPILAIARVASIRTANRINYGTDPRLPLKQCLEDYLRHTKFPIGG